VATVMTTKGADIAGLRNRNETISGVSA